MNKSFLFKELIREWDYERNSPLKPKDVTAYSNKKVWWHCKNGHYWQAVIAKRTYYKSGCPYCGGQKPCEENCLFTLKPSLSREWHPRSNFNLTPKDVTPFSNKKVWWRCKKGHSWRAVIYSRSRGTGCPLCRKG
jgi:hypothetical protein